MNYRITTCPPSNKAYCTSITLVSFAGRHDDLIITPPPPTNEGASYDEIVTMAAKETTDT